MSRFGINVESAWGISLPELRRTAREIGKDHELAAYIWDSGKHEARILACLIDDPKKVTDSQMELWVLDFDSWDLCDQCCSNLFDRTPYAWDKAVEWSERDEEFVKRAGFVLMAALAVHDKKAADGRFMAFLPLIRKQASDDRNFVKKAVNWALRQIGKRNTRLNLFAIEVAEELRASKVKSSRWIGSDAFRELTSDKVKKRLERKDISSP